MGSVHITTGVACATLPTSSSFCMIFFMRACIPSAMGFEMLSRQAVCQRGSHHWELGLLVLRFHGWLVVQVNSVNLRTQRVGGLYVGPGHTPLSDQISSLT